MPDMRPEKPFPTFIMGFPALVALLAIGFGLPLAVQSWTFVEESALVTAEVTAMRDNTTCSERRVSSGSGSTSRYETVCSTVYFPTVRYQTEDGAQFENEVMGFLNDPGVEPGDRVDVRYRIADPIVVQFARWRTMWGLPVGLIGLGLFFGACFGGMAWANRKARLSGRMVPGPVPQPMPVWVSVVTMILPLGMAALTGLIARDTIDFYQNSRVTSATVVEPMVDSTDHPVLEFVDHHGKTIIGATETNPFDTLNVAGRVIDVRYRLDEPAKFRAAVTSMSIWWPSLVLGIFASVFVLGFGGALVFMARG